MGLVGEGVARILSLQKVLLELKEVDSCPS